MSKSERLTDEQSARAAEFAASHRRWGEALLKRRGVPAVEARAVFHDAVMKAARQCTDKVSLDRVLQSAATDYLRAHGRPQEEATRSQQEQGLHVVVTCPKRMRKAQPKTPVTRAAAAAEVARRTGVAMKFKPAGDYPWRRGGREGVIRFNSASWQAPYRDEDPSSIAGAFYEAILAYGEVFWGRRRRKDSQRWHADAQEKQAKYLANVLQPLEALLEDTEGPDASARETLRMLIGMSLRRALGDPDWRGSPPPRYPDDSEDPVSANARFKAEGAAYEQSIARDGAAFDLIVAAVRDAAGVVALTPKKASADDVRKTADALRAFLAPLAKAGVDPETMAYAVGVMDPDGIDPTGAGAAPYYLEDLRERVRKNLPGK